MSSRWLKFSNNAINTAFIKWIDISPEKYVIHLTREAHYGTSIFGSGSIECENDSFTVSAKDSPKGYENVKKWIEEQP